MAKSRSRRNISDEEVALIRTMLRRGIDKTTIQAYFTHPDRRVNYGRITNIEQETYAPGISAATDEELGRFLERWRAARGEPSRNLAEASVNLSALGPVHPKRLLALFEEVANAVPCLRDGETEEVECKQGFHHPNNEKILRAIAALANNRGGHILFGVSDGGEVVGLKNHRFLELDPNVFSMAFRSAMEPVPRFEIGSFSSEGMLVGAIYVHPEPDRPVIATKDEGTYRAGMIYYRYTGESRGIGAAEFRRILSERERRARTEAGELARKAIELGGNAAILDLNTGRIEGRSAAFYVSPELLPKIQFIREGQFNEAHGATTLKLVGEVQVADLAQTDVVREKIVRQNITDADVLRDFLELASVEAPAEYILHGCHTGKHYLPLFYYARQARLTKDQLLELIASEETSHDAVRGKLLDRAHGLHSAGRGATQTSQNLTEAIRTGEAQRAETSTELRRLATALQGFKDTSIPVEKVLAFLKLLVAASCTLGWTDPGSEVRRAAVWIDDLYFRSDLPEGSSESGLA